MVCDFRHSRSSHLWRAIYMVCLVLVFSYILFDVLDIDGSDTPLPRAPAERSVIVAQVPQDTDHACQSIWVEPCYDHSSLFAVQSSDAMQLQRTEVHTRSPLDSARAHGFRLGLPRASLADPASIA